MISFAGVACIFAGMGAVLAADERISRLGVPLTVLGGIVAVVAIAASR